MDRPQTRDLRLLFSDGKSFCRDETNLDISVEHLRDTLGYEVRGRDLDGGYSFEKEIISDPHAPCVLQRIKLSGDAAILENLKVYALCSPNIGGGQGSTGECSESTNGMCWLPITVMCGSLSQQQRHSPKPRRVMWA